MLKEYKDKKSFREIKYNYVNFEIKDYKKIYDNNDMLKEVMTSDVLSGLDNFVIKMRIVNDKDITQGITVYMLFNNTNPIIEFYTYNTIDYKFDLDYVFDLSKFDTLDNIQESIVYCTTNNILGVGKYYLDMILKAIYYIKEKMVNRKIEYKQIQRNKKSNSQTNTNKKATPKKNIEVIGDSKTIYFTIDNITNQQLNTIKKTYNRHVESWYVLPHTRRYKSGKVIQVKGYIKGNREGKNINKTYVVE